jgi:hypothetical protein
MRCNYLIGALVVAVCAAGASRASAQNITGFTDGYNDVGPIVGFGNLGLGSVSYGGRFEHGFKELPNLGNGILGIQVGVDYYHFSTGFLTFSGYDYSVIPITVTVNYHFHLDNKQIDPFVGAGIGYEHFSVSGPSCVFLGVDYCANAYSNTTYGLVRGGIRYFWQPKIALYADVASKGAAIDVGLMFKVGGK